MTISAPKGRGPRRPRTTRGRRWSHKVGTASTFPRAELFTMNARTIAREMARKEVSPKGIGSGIRMIQFFINRAGKSLSPSRRRVREHAKRLLQSRRNHRATT